MVRMQLKQEALRSSLSVSGGIRECHRDIHSFFPFL